MNPQESSSAPPARSRALTAKLRFYADCKREQFRRWCFQKLLLYRHRGLPRYFVLWEQPLVLYAALNHETHALLPLPRGTLLMLALCESAEEPAGLEFTLRFCQRAASASPGARIVVLANTAAEETLLRARGVACELINHNAFMDERVFVMRRDAAKTFDAIYDAQLSPYKRHYLAAEIPRLALISYMHRPSPDLPYAREVRHLLRNATWLNDPLAPSYRSLDAAQVATALNSARTGLCLSESEGAMYASTQYLLCGLPVVNTPNRGGRDYFFEADFTTTVEPSAAAVATGVAAMSARAPDPGAIRNRTIAKMEALRERFVGFAQHHLAQHGTAGDFGARFRRDFFHTLLRKQKPPRSWTPLA